MEVREQTLTELLEDLRARGYTFDFGQENSEAFQRKITLAHKKYYGTLSADEEAQLVDLYVREYHRLEGMSDPSDNTIVYALETDKGLKGFLVNAYGIYSEDKQAEKEAVTPQEVSEDQVYDNSKTND